MADMEYAKNTVSASNAFSLFNDLRVPLESVRIGTRSTQLGEEICLVCRTGYALRDCLTEIDERSIDLHGRSVFLKESAELFTDMHLDVVSSADTYFGILPVVPDTVCRYTRGDLSKIVSDPWSEREGLLADYTMEDVLSRHNFAWVPRGVLAVVAGAYRLSRGFPATGRIGLGCYDDPGDCFRGNAVFGSLGLLAIATHRDGIVGFVHGFEPAKETTLDDVSFQTAAAGLSFKFTGVRPKD